MQTFISAGSIENETSWIESDYGPDSISPPLSHIDNRTVSWIKPHYFVNQPCGAAMPVGSCSEERIDRIQRTFRQYNVLGAEGGIIAPAEFPRYVSDTTTADVFIPGEGWVKRKFQPDRMYYKPICLDKDSGILGIPTAISVNNKGNNIVRVEGVQIQDDGTLLWGNEKYPDAGEKWNKFLAQLAKDYAELSNKPPQNKIDEICARYSLPKETSPGLYALFDDLEEIKRYGPHAIKTLLASPETVLQTVTDSTGKKTLDKNDDLITVVRMLTALRNRSIVEMIRKRWQGRIILQADCPYAGTMTKDDLLKDIQSAFELVSGLENVSLMIHSCSEIFDMSFLSESKIDGIHLDMFAYPSQTKGNKQFAEFMASENNFFSVGIVPTLLVTQFAEEVKYAGVLQGKRINMEETYLVDGIPTLGINMKINDSKKAVGVIKAHYKDSLMILYKRLSRVVDDIYETGGFAQKNIDKREIWTKIAVSSSCGQGSLDPEMSKIVYDLMRDLSYIVRAINIGIDYGVSAKQIIKEMGLD